MKDETRQILERVVEKAARLNNSRFARSLKENGLSIRLTATQQEIVRPDDEAVEAFILTFRFFIVKNEVTSFRALVRLLDDPDISDAWKEAFRQAREALNNFLAMQDVGMYTEEGYNDVPTNREVLDTFLYGGLAHANDAKAVEKFEHWKQEPFFFDNLQVWFIHILQQILVYISFVAKMSEKELQHLASK